MLKLQCIERPDLGEGIYQTSIIDTEDQPEWTPNFQRDLDNLFGNGTGEELMEYAQQHGLTYDEAHTLLGLLRAIDEGNQGLEFMDGGNE